MMPTIWRTDAPAVHLLGESHKIGCFAGIDNLTEAVDREPAIPPSC